MAVPEDDSLERLKGLHSDLVAVTESRLPNIDRLVAELESRVEELRNLLAKSPKNEKSRQTLLSGRISIDEEEVQINEDFKQDTIQLADFLDLDELEAAKLYNASIPDSLDLDRQSLVSAIFVFHERRQYLVECLRLCFKVASVDFEAEDDNVKGVAQALISLVVATNNSSGGGEPSFWQRTLTTMGHVEQWLQQVTERVQAVSITGQNQAGEFGEIMAFQHTSLTRQHESLAAIAYHLVDAGYVVVADFRSVLTKLKTLDKYDMMNLHYLPILWSCIVHFAANEGRCSMQEAADLNHTITSIKDNDAWVLRGLQAAATCSWVAEYSVRFVDDRVSSEADAIDGDGRSKTFIDALNDGAFQFLLSVAQHVGDSPWFDPLRQGITTWLMQDSPTLQNDTYPSEHYFKELLTTQMQTFIEAFITNMPDTLRTMRVDEDEQRRQTQGRVQLTANDRPLHLERFYIIASYAFEISESASESFWTDSDSNLHGFLVWASQRQPTPRIAAFCELLRALSYGENNGNHAHRFLLEDKSAVGRMRRASPLSWHHITSELEFYSSTIRDRPALQPGKGQDEQALVEPESAMMLECYLRLISHLCHQSPEAREWFLTHPTFHLHDHLLLLCSSSIETRLRANAYTALSSLMVGKTPDIGDAMWGALDAWIYGIGNTPPSAQRHSKFQNAHAAAEKAIFESIATGFEEPNAFVGFLVGLITPSPALDSLNDSLPFPESLGSAYRMPGMESYVDFVLGRVFAQKSRELQDPIQIRVLRSSCLRFASICLSTFNEDLVVFANSSSVSVDSSIRTSSLATYAKLHPFARVLEWFFHDGTIAALFATVQQDIREVNEAESDSPLILGLLQGIQIINLILTLQSTYFDIVRPIIKLQSTARRPPVANSALASFEDAILNNLELIPSLGLYSGSGHQDLAIASLQLLQNLASSRKLVAPVSSSAGRQLDRSRLITALERNNQGESIARSLVTQMQFEGRLIEQGPECPGIVIQFEILNFLNTCLGTIADRPTIAHSLLGFTCYAHTLDVAPQSLFARGGSLFHAVMQYLAFMPDGDQIGLVQWLLSAKALACGILAKLLKSSLSSQLTITELRLSDFLISQWGGQPKVGPRTLWDGKTIEAPDFLIADSGLAYLFLLQQRTFLLDCAAIELRSVDQEGLATLKTRIVSTLMGTATFSDGQEAPCATLFDLIDFLDTRSDEALAPPMSRFFDLADLEACSTIELGQARYDLAAAEQLLMLRSNEVHKGAQPVDEQQSQQLEADARNILQYLLANNRRLDMQVAQISVLKSWVQLMTLLLNTADFEPANKTSFILQSIQVILPRLEQAYTDDVVSANLYASLAHFLLRKADLSSTSSNHNIAAETTHDRLFTLFRVALAGFQDASATSPLRLTCAHICQDYLRGISTPGHATQRILALQSIKGRGDRLMEVLCDEAFAGTEQNRIAALLLLGTVVYTSNTERDKHMIEALARFNFVTVLVTSLRHMPADFMAAERSENLPTIYTTILALLLSLSQTRSGATAVINAGLLPAVRDSGLFSTDPDLGLDTTGSANTGAGEEALTSYFHLLTAIVRILLACLISRGAENEGMMCTARGFCAEYRLLIVGVFKRSAGVTFGGAEREGTEMDAALKELADTLTVFVTSCGWLEEGEEVALGKAKRGRGVAVGVFS